MILGHIGVRAGSKGVPGKNFRPICGKPLIDWSLDQLLAHPDVDEVVVSTDSPEIYAHAVAKGTLAIGLRPDHLATDTAGKWGVWQHALAASEALTGPVTAFLDLDATSPLREARRTSPARWRCSPPSGPTWSCPAARRGRTPTSTWSSLTPPARSMSPSPCRAGWWRASRRPPFTNTPPRPTSLRRTMFEGRVIPYLMPPERCIDIDTEFDFRMVEWLLKERAHAP
ncbi:MAG: acylneuraminate cytidylyltransferase family protein [Rhodobacteraceae bacterium]|nr:acylneuraminate cytidylyltransferase family protein [Paracoccaceae bacterium]